MSEEVDPVEAFLAEMYRGYNPNRGMPVGVVIVMPSGWRVAVSALSPEVKPYLRGPVPKDLHDYGTNVQVYYHKDCLKIF